MKTIKHFSRQLMLIALIVVSLIVSPTVGSELKPLTAGLVLRGKAKQAFCDHPLPGIDGAYCQIPWSELQPTESTFNFTLIDNALEAAHIFNNHHGLTGKNRFRVLLRVRAGVDSPDWVKRWGTVNWYFRDTDDAYTLPLFWEKPYQNAYRGLMEKLAEKYDDHALFGEIAASMCMTKHAETMWNRTGRKPVRALNMKNLRSARTSSGKPSPYTNELDWDCLVNQIDVFNEVWLKTSTIYGTHLYQTYDYTTGEKTPNMKPTVSLFNICRKRMGKRCVLGNNSLSNSKKIPGTVYEPILKAGKPIYYQTSTFGRGSFDLEDLYETLEVGVEWKSHMMELPMGWDCKNIYRPSGCTLELAAERAAAMLKSRMALKANLERSSGNVTMLH